MTDYVPACGNHAIDQAIVGVRWRNAPTDEAYAKALEIAAQIAKDFGLSGRIQIDAMALLIGRQNITFGYDCTPDMQSGHLFQQVYPDGQMAQEMTLERRAITFRTRQYRRWDDVKNLIETAICPLAGLLANDDPMNLSVIELRCVDKFSTQDEALSLENLVRKDAPFVANFVKDRTGPLHCHVGWFDEISSYERYLYNVNCDVVPSDGGGTTATILKVLARHMNLTAAPPQSVHDLISSAFADLHGRDKTLLGDTVNENLARRINLEGSSQAIKL